MPDRHPCETCGTPTWLERRWCGPGCEEIAVMAAKTREELAREIVSVADLAELDE